MGWLVCWSVSSCFPLENRTQPGLLSISCPLPTHSLGRSLCFLLRITSKKRECNSYSPELTWRKRSPGQKTGNKRKTWEYLWRRPEVQDERGSGTPEANGKTTARREKHFTVWCKSYSIILMECIWGRGGCESLPWVVMSLSWTPLVLQFFIHSSIHSVLTKHLLTTQANTRVVTKMKKKLFKITTESSSQTHHPRRSFLAVVSLRVGHPEDRPRKAEGLSSGHTPALSLKCLPNLPNSTQTMKMTWWFVDSQAHQEIFPLSCSN